MAAIGEQVRVAGLALAGVTVLAAEEPEAVRDAWRDVRGGAGLVILTPAAADALGPAVLDRIPPLTAVLPR
ncbi:V-type ATP synthase subunit F [Streptomyces sp. NBRC 110611]|uniref:V-type ATP synthase subunit F n=1 Tax=Streptomyces sp. NBRC 110611 TaxID=1621259 RepID=UPI00215C1F7A|nr:V-type ATP synthase subunit F [Streptomyces sp. NBRC 110611]